MQKNFSLHVTAKHNIKLKIIEFLVKSHPVTLRKKTLDTGGTLLHLALKHGFREGCMMHLMQEYYLDVSEITNKENSKLNFKLLVIIYLNTFAIEIRFHYYFDQFFKSKIKKGW